MCRVPRYSNMTLTKWIKSTTPADVFRALQHMHERAILVMELINESDLIIKNSCVPSSPRPLVYLTDMPR